MGLFAASTSSAASPIKLESVSLPYLSTPSVDLVQEIHQHCSLGFHVAMYAKLRDGSECAFVERYLDCELPVNGAHALSLTEVAESGGPKLAAHELVLAIRGITDPDQIRLVRRIRAEIPELIEVDGSGRDVKLTFASPETLTPKVIYRLGSLIAHSFKKRMNLDVVPRKFHPSVVFTPEERSYLQEISRLAWRELPGASAGDSPHLHSRKKSAKPPSRSSASHPKFVQSVVIDIAKQSVSLIEEGPGVSSAHSSRHAGKNAEAQFSLTRVKTGGMAWQDTVRAAILRLAVPIESIRVNPSGHDLSITALITPGAEKEIQSIPPKINMVAPFQTRIDAVTSNSTVTRLAFEIIPPDWGFKRIVESPCSSKALVLCRRLLNIPRVDEVRDELEKRTRRKVFLDDTRFNPASPHDPNIPRIIAQLPSGVGLQKIERCQVAGDYLLRTVRRVPESIMRRVASSIGYPVSQVQPYASIPVNLRTPADIISKAPAVHRNLSPHKHDPLRELTVFGGVDIGGSALALGDEIIIDQGGWPRDSQRKVDLRGTRWESPRAVVISHSHHDHVGNVVSLWQQTKSFGSDYPCQFIMHEAIALSMWFVLLEQQKRPHCDFTKRDLEGLYKQIRLAPLDYPVALSPRIALTMIPAGHHIGSTMNLFEYSGPAGCRRVLYTGDIKCDADYGQSRLYPAAGAISGLDAIVIEGTNGMAPFLSREELERTLLEEILEAVEHGGTAVLPVLASGRAQEVLTVLRRNMHLFRDIGVPIYVDGTSIYEYNSVFSYLAAAYPDLLRIRDRQLQGWQGINDKDFKEIPSRTKKNFFKDSRPKVVVVSGGMGWGPSFDYIKAFDKSPNNKIIFTCYQAPNSVGASLLAHSADPSKNSKLADCRAQIRSCRLSGHNSGQETLDFVRQSLTPGGTVVLTHGSEQNLREIQDALQAQGHASRVEIAHTGKTISLW